MTGWFMSGVKVLGVMLVALVSMPVWAQQQSLGAVEKLTAAEKDKVGVILTQQQRNFGEPCTNIKLLKAETLSVMEPVVTDAQSKPTRGRWTARYSVDACGKIALRTVAFGVVPGGLSIDPLIPGNTLADETLQADVVKSFTMAGQVAMPQCAEQAVVRDTNVRIFPKTGKDRWMEMWIGQMCGRDLGQMVEFLPTARGTTFKMSLPTKSVKPAVK